MISTLIRKIVTIITFVKLNKYNIISEIKNIIFISSMVNNNNSISCIKKYNKDINDTLGLVQHVSRLHISLVMG